MTNLMQHASRLALVATLTATPFVLSAQDTTVKPVVEGTNAEAEAQAPVTEDSTATDSAQAPVTEETASDTAEVPMTDEAATDETVVEAPAEEMAKPVEGQIAMQSENTILAEDLIGSNIYSETGEKVGKVEDLIVNLDGTIEGVVIGVGGFLGIGEKWVALEMASLATATDESGTLRLVTSATKVDLEAAEPFLTAQDMEAAKLSLETMPAVDPNAAAVDDTQPVATE